MRIINRLNIPVQCHLRQYKVFPVPSQGNLPYSDPEHNTSGLQAVSHTEYSSNPPAQPLESRNDLTRYYLLSLLQVQQSQHSGKEMADAFVDSIIIHGKYDYEIKLAYDDQFADLQKLKKEKEAQSR